MNLDIIKEDLKENLSEEKYRHSLEVAKVASKLADNYDYDRDKAYLAGLIHDIAKEVPGEELFNFCLKNNIGTSELEEKNKNLLHGKVGAYLVKLKYKIDDNHIYNSIFYHTTGRPNMSILEKIIYIADYIEPSRKPLPRIDEIREMSLKSLDDSMKLIMQDTLESLKHRKLGIDKITIEAYNYYFNKV